MAHNINIRWRRDWPGAGFDSSGNPKQGKSFVQGVINVTSYQQDAESLTANDFGLETVDFVVFDVQSHGSTTYPDAGTLLAAQWDRGDERLHIETNANAGTELGAGGVATVGFLAFGDSALVVDAV